MPKLKIKNIITRNIRYHAEFAMTAIAAIASKRDR
jgi:hypothetical protein